MNAAKFLQLYLSISLVFVGNIIISSYGAQSALLHIRAEKKFNEKILSGKYSHKNRL